MKDYYEGFIEKDGAAKVSRPGEYSGYSKAEYDGFKWFSEYVTMRDGVKIAVTYYRPTLEGKLVEKPLPVIWRHTPYGSIQYAKDGSIHHMVCFSGDGAGMGPAPKIPDDYVGEHAADDLQTGADLMIKVFTSHGYVMAQADVRGKFASFGFRKSANTELEAMDGYEINEWLAAQSWCDGNVGMMGSSYTGQTQLETLRKRPPHLKASVVCMTDIDKFDGWAMGGIPRGGDMNMAMPDNVPVIVPVDADKDGSLLKQALEQHKLNKQDIPVDESDPKHLPYYNFGRLYYRDDFSKTSGTRFWIDDSASSHLDEINAGHTAVYLIGGWHDVFRRDTMMLFNNITLPHKMIVGPWYHTRYKKELNLFIEHMRFYDYWLKGIDNGIMDEPPIYMKTLHSETGYGESWQDGWRFEDQWPVAGTEARSFFLSEGGVLADKASESSKGADIYTSDYTVGDWEEQDYAEDIVKKGLVYTTEALAEDINVTGHPMVDIHFTSTGKDGDFFTFLLDVDEEGRSYIVSIGRLRTSFRATAKAPYNTIGIPWHRCYREDEQLPDFSYGPVALTIDMKPTSYVFKKGHRIQLAITTSMSRFQFYQESPAPVVTLEHNALYPSRMTLQIRK